MPMGMPKNLMELLEKLDSSSCPVQDQQRTFRRFSLRSEARLETLDDSLGTEPFNVLLRDISRGGIGFISDRFIEPGSMWRARLRDNGQIVGSQPIFIHYCRRIEDGAYLAGAQFIVESFLMRALGVPPSDLHAELMRQHTPFDVSEFKPPQDVTDE